MTLFQFFAWLGIACLLCNAVTMFVSNRDEPWWSTPKKLVIYALDIIAGNVGRNRNDPSV